MVAEVAPPPVVAEVAPPPAVVAVPELAPPPVIAVPEAPPPVIAVPEAPPAVAKAATDFFSDFSDAAPTVKSTLGADLGSFAAPAADAVDAASQVPWGAFGVAFTVRDVRLEPLSALRHRRQPRLPSSHRPDPVAPPSFGQVFPAAVIIGSKIMDGSFAPAPSSGASDGAAAKGPDARNAQEIISGGLTSLGKDPTGWFFGKPSALYSNEPFVVDRDPPAPPPPAPPPPSPPPPAAMAAPEPVAAAAAPAEPVAAAAGAPAEPEA